MAIITQGGQKTLLEQADEQKPFEGVDDPYASLEEEVPTVEASPVEPQQSVAPPPPPPPEPQQQAQPTAEDDPYAAFEEEDPYASFEEEDPYAALEEEAPVEEVPDRRTALKELTKKGESGGDYNIYNMGTTGKTGTADFENMTIKELTRRQSLPKNHKDRIFAAGAFQVIPSTMKEAIKALNLKPTDTFSMETQDRILNWIYDVKKPIIGKYLNGEKVDEVKVKMALSEEFASYPSPVDRKFKFQGKTRNVKAGESLYGGLAGNVAHIKNYEVDAALQGRASAGPPPKAPAIDLQSLIAKSGKVKKTKSQLKKEVEATKMPVAVHQLLGLADMATDNPTPNNEKSWIRKVTEVGIDKILDVTQSILLNKTLRLGEQLTNLVLSNAEDMLILTHDKFQEDPEKNAEYLKRLEPIQDALKNRVVSKEERIKNQEMHREWMKAAKKVRLGYDEEFSSEATNFVTGGGSFKQMGKNMVSDTPRFAKDLVPVVVEQTPQFIGGAISKTFAVLHETARMSDAISKMEEELGITIDDDIKSAAEYGYGIPFGALSHLTAKMAAVPGASGIAKAARQVQGKMLKRMLAITAAKFGTGFVEAGEEVVQDQAFKYFLLYLAKAQAGRIKGTEESLRIQEEIDTQVNNLWNQKEIKQSAMLGFLIGTGVSAVTGAPGDVKAVAEEVVTSPEEAAKIRKQEDDLETAKKKIQEEKDLAEKEGREPDIKKALTGTDISIAEMEKIATEVEEFQKEEPTKIIGDLTGETEIEFEDGVLPKGYEAVGESYKKDDKTYVKVKVKEEVIKNEHPEEYLKILEDKKTDLDKKLAPLELGTISKEEQKSKIELTSERDLLEMEIEQFKEDNNIFEDAYTEFEETVEPSPVDEDIETLGEPDIDVVTGEEFEGDGETVIEIEKDIDYSDPIRMDKEYFDTIEKFKKDKNTTKMTKKDALKKIIASQDKGSSIQKLAKALLPHVDGDLYYNEGGWDVYFNIGEKRVKAGGNYDPRTHDISLFEKGVPQSTVMHEMIHSISSKAIAHPETKADLEYSLEIDRLFELAKKELNQKEYAMANAHEFVAEAFSNYEFIQKMSNIKDPDGKGEKSLFDSFKNTVKQYFEKMTGIKFSKKEQSVFDSIIGATSLRLTENKKAIANEKKKAKQRKEAIIKKYESMSDESLKAEIDRLTEKEWEYQQEFEFYGVLPEEVDGFDKIVEDKKLAIGILKKRTSKKPVSKKPKKKVVKKVVKKKVVKKKPVVKKKKTLKETQQDKFKAELEQLDAEISEFESQQSEFGLDADAEAQLTKLIDRYQELEAKLGRLPKKKTEKKKSKKLEGLKKIFHFTKKENIKKILSEGFKKGLPPIHGMTFKGNTKLNISKIGGKTGVLYFTTDMERWSEFDEEVGTGKGDKDKVYFDYDKQEWITEKKSLIRKKLDKIEATINENAKILELNSSKIYRKTVAIAKNHVEKHHKDMVNKHGFLNGDSNDWLIIYAKDQGYDVLNINNSGNWKVKTDVRWSTKLGKEVFNEEDVYDKATANGGKDDYFIINENILDIKGKTTPTSTPSKEVEVEENSAASKGVKIISGGQTGVDQAGLYVAKELGMETGGIAPKGYRTESGENILLKDDFGLAEDNQSNYAVRTEKNVQASDGTVLFGDMESAGSAQTIKFAKKHNKPYLINPTGQELANWISSNGIETVNVAGNRGSKLKAEQVTEIENALREGFSMAPEGSKLSEIGELVKGDKKKSVKATKKFHAIDPNTIARTIFKFKGKINLKLKFKEVPFPVKATARQKKLVKLINTLRVINSFLNGQSSYDHRKMAGTAVTAGNRAVIEYTRKIEELQLEMTQEKFKEPIKLERESEVIDTATGKIKRLFENWQGKGTFKRGVELESEDYYEETFEGAEDFIQTLNEEISSDPDFIIRDSKFNNHKSMRTRDKLISTYVYMRTERDSKIEKLKDAIQAKEEAGLKPTDDKLKLKGLEVSYLAELDRVEKEIMNWQHIVKRNYVGLYSSTKSQEITDTVEGVGKINEEMRPISSDPIIEEETVRIDEAIEAIEDNKKLEQIIPKNEAEKSALKARIFKNNQIILDINKNPDSNLGVIYNAVSDDFSYAGSYEYDNADDIMEGTLLEKEQGIEAELGAQPEQESRQLTAVERGIKVLRKPVNWTSNLASTISRDVGNILQSKKAINRFIGTEWVKLQGKYKRAAEGAQFIILDITEKTTQQERAAMPFIIQAKKYLRGDSPLSLYNYKIKLAKDIEYVKNIIDDQVGKVESKILRIKQKKLSPKEMKKQIEEQEAIIKDRRRSQAALGNVQNFVENVDEARLTKILDMSSDLDRFNEALLRANRAAFPDMDIRQQVDYVAQIWGKKDFTDKTGEIDINKFRKFLTENRFLEDKFFTNYLDGIRQGMNPRFWDIAEIVEMNSQTSLQSISNRMVVSLLEGKNKLGLQLLTKDQSAEDVGYIKVSRLGIEVDGIKDMYVHPDARPALRAIFQDRNRNKYWSLVELLNGIAKKMNLTGSFFHHLTLLESSIGTEGAQGMWRRAKALNPVELGKKVKSFNLGDNAPNVIKTIKDGSYHILLQKWSSAADFLEHGGQLGSIADVYQDQIDKGLEKLQELSKATRIPGLELAAKSVRGANTAMDRFLWDYLHNSLKIDGYDALLDQNMRRADKKFGEVNADLKEVIKIETARQINDTYGGQNWRALMTSPRNLQFAQILLLSPDWTLSTFKQFFSIFGKFSQLKTSEAKWVRKQMGRTFWTQAALIYGTSMQMLNAVMRYNDDDEEWADRVSDLRNRMINSSGSVRTKYARELSVAMANRPNQNWTDPETWLNLSTFGNSVGNKFSVFFGRSHDGREIYRSPGKQFKEAFEYALDLSSPEAVDFIPHFSPTEVFKRLSGKVSPILRAASIAVSGNTLSGHITGWDSQTAKLRRQGRWPEAVASTIVDVANQALPFSFSNILERPETMIEEGRVFKKDVSPFDIVIGKKGVTKSKLRKAMRTAYDDLFRNKKRNKGIASSGAINKFKARVDRINKSAIRNGFDPLPLYNEVINNTIKGIEEGSKDRIWKTMGALTKAEKEKRDAKQLKKKTIETLRAKRYYDNMVSLRERVMKAEKRLFKKASKGVRGLDDSQ